MMHSLELARFLRSQIPNATDAQDLMQELYLAVLKVPCSQPIRHPKAYLYKIAANLAHQHRLRIKARPIHVALDEVSAQILLSAHPKLEANAPEAACALAEHVSQLGQRLGELSPKVQAVILWHHRDGYTCAEIGAKLSIAQHRVKKYLVKGLSHCRTASAVPEFV
jgi:RNA polymerase sigma factor (sigma-70 family)